jgi:ABC-type branched-subunit amino acid transport system ATPase component
MKSILGVERPDAGIGPDRRPRGRRLAAAPDLATADERAVLIVDHNVESISALVDHIYAIHGGERIARSVR